MECIQLDAISTYKDDIPVHLMYNDCRRISLTLPGIKNELLLIHSVGAKTTTSLLMRQADRAYCNWGAAHP